MPPRLRRARGAAAVAAATVGLAIPVAIARAAEPGTNAPAQGAAVEEPAAGFKAGAELNPAQPESPGKSESQKGSSGSSPEGSGKEHEGAAVQEGSPLAPAKPAEPATQSPAKPPNGGTNAAQPNGKPQPQTEPSEAQQEQERKEGEAATKGVGANPGSAFTIPSLPSSACAPTGVPPVLVPIYQAASAQYGLGPQGPAILAGINAVETNFGSNLGPSSAGAVGWMQFMPATWETYGVDANGDGVKDPNNPEDAIFAAAGYLAAAGMPADTYGAIFAYNHAGWYVSEVLANAGCYAHEVGDPAFTSGSLGPQIQVLHCDPAAPWRKQIPPEYMEAFEEAAGRYELGRRGVWALAAVARLESSFGRGMDKHQLRTEGPLGLDPTEWKRYAVDGNGDGRVRHADIADSAATLARLIWSQGSLEAGVFSHNQAEWYVQQVMQGAEEIEGACKVSYIDWRVAPLATGTEVAGEQAVLGPEGLASAPRSAPPAVKAAIAAANSIATTPYVWGGGHGSWYSYGYDCSGAVSFALYGGGLLNTPLTSGALESYGEPGPGKWITIYANATHTYMVVAGLRWDTVGDASGTGPRWHAEPPYPEGFVVRHPVGY
jgi:soluble lytic murein transglycosylase-like protein